MFWRRGTSSNRKKPKSPGRKRIAAGWVLLVVGVLVTGVWGASRWTRMTLRCDPWVFVAVCGQLYLTQYTDPVPQDIAEPSGMSWKSTDTPQWIWAYSSNWFQSRSLVIRHGVLLFWVDTGVRTIVGVLLWPFALASLLGGGWLVWAGRRVKHRAVMRRCRTCGYDLAGLGAAAPCPECGKEQLRDEAASRRTV